MGDTQTSATASPRAFHFERNARTSRTAAALIAWWVGLALLYLLVQAHPGILAGLLLLSLPAVYEFGANASSSLAFTEDEISWRAGRQGDALPRSGLKRVRLDTRLDLSVRMTLERHQGRDIRLPYQCVPPMTTLEAGLKAANLPYVRNNFSLIG